jgi:4-azaleucine resistance transporter AzlC
MFALTDEAYALTASRDPGSLTSGHILWTQVGLHVSWASGALVGGLVGATALRNVRGLGFILTSLFVVLVIDAYRARPDTVTLVTAVVASLVALVVARGSMVLVSMTIFTAALVVRHRLARSRPKDEERRDEGAP